MNSNSYRPNSVARRSVIATFVAAVIFLLLAAFAPPAQADWGSDGYVYDGWGTYKGTFLTPDGGPRDPQSDVRAQLWGPGGGGQQAPWNQDGTFTFIAPAGTYFISIEDYGYRYKRQYVGGGTDQDPNSHQMITITAGQVTQGITAALVAFPHGDITGTITEIGGSPVLAWSGVDEDRGDIWAVNGSEQYPGDADFQAKPDSTGKYTLDRLPLGSYQLRYSNWWGMYSEGWLGADGRFTANKADAIWVTVTQDQTTEGIDGQIKQAVFLAGRVTVAPGVSEHWLGCLVPVVRDAHTGYVVSNKRGVGVGSAGPTGYWRVIWRDANFENTPLEPGDYTVRFTYACEGDSYYGEEYWTDENGDPTISVSGIRTDLNITLSKQPPAPAPGPAPVPVPVPDPAPAPDPDPGPYAPLTPGTNPGTPAFSQQYNPVTPPVGSTPPAGSTSKPGRACRTFTGSAGGHNATVRYCSKNWTPELVRQQNRRAKELARIRAHRIGSHS